MGYGGSNPPLPTNLRSQDTKDGDGERATAGKPQWTGVGMGGGRMSDGGLTRRSVGRGGHEGGSNSVVESQPSKLLVAGSIPVSRSSLRSGGARTERRLASLDFSSRTGPDRLEAWGRAADWSAVAASEASDWRRPM